MESDPRRKLGEAGELLAARHLEAAGFEILTRNWRCSHGELDLIAQEIAPDYVQGGAQVTWLVLVEVRIRRGHRFGTALASVTPTKQAKLRQVAAAYVQASGWHGPWRIDVVAIQLDGQGRMQQIDHLRHAVTG